MQRRENLRTVAIVAHVDHGKTTLVDALFQQSGVYRAGQQVVDRAMDSMDQERERGITIMAKTTSVQFGDLVLQLVDTPGHSDFGGEVERTLRMVDGILLLVDAAEGPLPQTRFVLRKALELGLPAVACINKIDRSDARPMQVLDELYELFIDLGANEEQINFPVLFTIARDGMATTDPEKPGKDLAPLIDALVNTIPPAEDSSDEPFCMQVNSLGYDDYVGRLVVGRVLSGRIRTNEMVRVRRTSESKTTGGKTARITGVFRFQGTQRLPLAHAQTADIIALSGLDDVGIGDVLTHPEHARELTRIHVDEPTVGMIFQVNDGPFSGRSGGRFLTSRHLRERLTREAYANVSIRVQDTESKEQLRVLGRGELQLSVLLESLRREAFELCARNPEVLTRDTDEGKQEPTERLVVDVETTYIGSVTELLGRRRAQLLDQRPEGTRTRLEYIIPTRGLFGLRNQLLTTSRGTALVHSVFEGWIPWTGPISKRQNGALVSDREGVATAYALFNLQARGVLFIEPGTRVYEGMVVGEHNRDNDLNVNVCREKKLTNVRSSGKDDSLTLAPPRQMTLEICLEWIRDDEIVEVTPDAIRVRKRVLQANRRPVLQPVGL